MEANGRGIGSRLVAMAMVISMVLWAVVVGVTPASALPPDPGVATLVSTLDGPANSLQSWSQGLGSVGKLGDALPAVQTSPGSVLGFADLLHQWFNNGATHLSNAASDGDLNINEPISLGDGRSGNLTSQLSALGNGDKQLDVTVTAQKTLTDQPLSVPVAIGSGSNAPQSAYSSTGGVSLAVSGTLTFTLVWEHASDTVYIVANGTTPSLQIDANGTLANAASVKAAIGILGVSLVNDSTLALSVHLVGTVNDPNNDGKLAFNATDGGELAQAGSLAGLVSFGFAASAGSLNAHLHLNAAPAASFSLNLPAVDATIDWNWSDISTSPPAPTASGIDVAGKFLNMSPRDIADGLGQLVTSLTMIQQSKSKTSPSFGNLDLPFVKGSLADAVRLNEILGKFLKDNTVDASVDPARAGDPTFTSLQDLLDKLNSDTTLPAGQHLSLSNVHFDDTTSKLAFTIELQRGAGPATDLNAAAAAASGGAGTTYTVTTLTDNTQTWTPDEWKNRHVVAGTQGATVLGNTAHTLTLQASGWAPGGSVPAAGSPYSISGMAGDVGVVQFGNSLESSGHGISGANAVNATAQVAPSYDAHITLVLDLQPPVIHDPPLEVHNPDGTTTLESSTPIGADRVLVRTSDTDLFHADFPISAGIDLFANAGFLQVELKGQVKVCEKSLVAADCAGTSSTHMLQVSFKDNGDLTFGQIVHDLLTDPTSLLDFQTSVGATGSVTASVPQAANFVSGTPTASFHWNDLAQGSGSDGPQFDLSQLNPFSNFDFDPSNPKALFSIVLKTLQTLDSVLGSSTASSASVFTSKIPLVGRSLSDLLKSDESGQGAPVTFGPSTIVDSSRSTANGNAFPQSLVGRTVVVGTQIGVIASVTVDTLTMDSAWSTTPAPGTPYVVRSELDDAISLLEASPSDNLQQLIQTINDRLKGSLPITFSYEDDSKVSGIPSLVIKLDWKRDFHTSAPVQFDFHLPIGDQSLAGVQGKGSVSLGVKGEVKLGLVVPLQAGNGPADGGALQILNDSRISAQLDASVDKASLATTIGPLSISLGDPTSSNAADKAQAKASYSVDLGSNPADGSAENFDTFIGGVTPTVDANSTAVDCGLGGSTPLSLCATLPLYISDDGGVTYTKLIDPGANAFEVRLPQQPQTSDPLDIIDLTGGQIDGHDRLSTPDATALGNAIASHIIDFTQINGIDGFLNLIQQAMNAASFGGKLPLIGNDLQQGADFISKLRDSLHQAIGQLPSDGHFTDTSGIRDWVNNKLAGALTSANLDPQLVTVDTECSDTLGSVTPAPGEALSSGATAGTTHYHYAIASYIKNSNGDVQEAKPSPQGDIANGPDGGLTSTNSLDITWTSVTGATGYRVYRDDGSGLKLVKDVGSALNFSDDGTNAPGDAPQDPAQNPALHDCSYDNFDSVIIRVDVSEGDFTGGTLDCTNNSKPCITKSVPLDIGVPGLSLKATNAGDGPTVQLGWHLHLAFGISRSDGFFVAANDQPGTPELAVGLNFDLAANSDLAAQLAFINITAHNCTSGSADQALGCGAGAPASAKHLFSGVFSIDLTSPHSSGRLTVNDLSDANLSDLFKVTLSAEAAIDWLLKAKIGSDAGFPGVQAEFRLHWGWHNADPSANDTSGGDSPLDISFTNVAIDAGEVFGRVLKPIINEIKQVTGPLDPIVKTLYAPIPVLSDLSHLVGGGDVTIVSIAKAFSTLADGPDLSFVDTVVSLINFVNHLPTCTNQCLIPIGSFSLDGSNALSTTATPDNTQQLIKTGSEALDAGVSGGGGALGALDGKDSSGSGSLDGGGDPTTSASAKSGFSFPVFEKPASLFNLLLGGDVDLVKFDSGPLTLGFDWRQEFGPVYAPPPVLITLHGSASVTLHIVAGFDTYGIRKAFEAARAGTLDLGTVGEAILQSLFFYTNDDKGKPMPVVSFTGELAAGAEVSVVLLTVGIEGGVGLTVSFLWNDPNHDGKFRISEFLATALNNPICLFSVSGQLFVFLKAYISIGVGPFSISFSFTIVNVTLLDFSATPDCAPPPPKLGGLSADGTTLVVYAGGWGHTAQRGNTAYDNSGQPKETVKVTEVHDFTDPANPAFKGVAIDMLGIRREFDNPNIQRVIVDGRGYGKEMDVTFIGDGKADTSRTGAAPPTASFDKDAIVFGGDGNDQIKTGVGNSWVDGGKGNDVIVTGDRTVLVQDSTTHAYSYVRPDAKAIVAGGEGDDSITVGNGDDVVAGDSSLGSPPTVALNLTDLVNDGRDSGDPLASGQGHPGAAVTVPDWANLPNPGDGTGTNDGIDTIKLGLGHVTGYGNGGNDVISVSSDNALLAAHPSQADLFHSQGATLVGGDGGDHLAGGAGDDTIFTASQTTFGVDDAGPVDAGPPNVVDTGTGNDQVYGSTSIDLVTGHSKPTQSDDIRGGDGNDVLIGGLGTDKIYGGPGDDYVIAEPSTVDLGSGPPPDDGFGPVYNVTHTALPDGVSPSSKLLVGGLGRDHIIGGDGGAQVYGDQQTSPCVAGNPVASDAVSEAVNTLADGADRIIGGAGVENVRAGGGDDYVDVKGNNDSVCGESGNDTLIGGDGNDQLWGGSGQDQLQGGTGNDLLYGNDGNDTLYGGDGNDRIEGNNGSDFASGGAGDDVILGGTRAARRPDQNDVLSGDTGQDIIIGDNGDVVGGVWVPLDLSGILASAGGNDTIFGGDGNDVCHGGIGDDVIYAGNGDDHCEGNGGNDTIFGQAGEDELVGGGYEQSAPGVGYPDGNDTIDGGTGNDVVTGDNAIVATSAPASATDTVQGRGFNAGHTIQLLDLGYSPAAGTSGNDVLQGGDDNDVVYGQGGNDTISGGNGDDYAEGDSGTDTIAGGSGADDLVGGSSVTDHLGSNNLLVGQPDSGDAISGGDASDVIIGDNGKVLRDGTPVSPLTVRPGMTPARAIVLYDLTGSGAPPASSGNDYVTGDAGNDVVLGQGGDDQLLGNAGDDYVEGDQGSDLIEGDTGNDDLVGGSSTVQSSSGLGTVGQADASDQLFGGPGDDVITGDNALVLRDPSLPRTSTTDRLGTSTPNARMDSRNITLFDLNGANPLVAPPATQYGDDRISGGAGTDVLYGQDGNDQLSGGANGDYIEGNGGNDVLRGDALLDAPPTTPGEAATSLLANPNWQQPMSAFADLQGAGPDGQDDMVGGSSRVAFRDGNDSLEGDGESDFQLGDNGTLKRTLDPLAGGGFTERVFALRYPALLPPNAAVIRSHDPAVANPNGTTRFCTTAQTTCEPAGAYGNDTMWGDGGNDTMWGQDGNDTMHGGAGNDDMYGELGDDVMFGDDGNDAILGDRGGVVDTLNTGSSSFVVSLNSPPAESYTGLAAGTLDHRVDLLHDIDGAAFVGSSTSGAMPHAGLTEGGNDRIRGGNGADNIHAGFGDDLANGDSGGDVVFGDDGADVLWGGKGCDAAVDTSASSPDCFTNGAFDPTARGTNGRFIDHLWGGTGGTSAASLQGALGSDVMDWHPRGTYASCTASPWPATIGSQTNDPCSWFQMTNTDDDTSNPATLANNQHHQGTDWMYGGWDRDVMQGDVAQNGPNPGDRLLDWTGAYNLYTHCNSAYGGFNDVRQQSPAMQTFLQQVSYSDGAGQGGTDSSTSGTSAFRELAMVYPSDINGHGAGSAYPSTPGHFDNPNACAP